MLNNQSHLFSLPADITYLNCAYMSPLMKSVVAAGEKGIAAKQDPTQIVPSHFFEGPKQLREEFAKLIGASNPDHCAVVPAVSYALANVGKNLDAGKGHNIVMLEEQFPSNVYAWKHLEKDKGLEIRTVYAPDTQTQRGRVWNERVLDAIDDNSRLVTMPHVHWADGTLYDLKAIRQRSKEVGALLVIDGTQSVGALPFDVNEIEPDMIVAAGYKWLMGPYASGVAYYGEYFHDKLPFENSWMHRLGSEDFAGLVNYQDEYQPGAIRFEVGQSANFILNPMLTEALRQVNAWGAGNIQEYCQELTQEPLKELREKGFTLEDDEARAHHLFGVRLPAGIDINVLKQRFIDMGIFVSLRGSSVRISPHLYNSQNDMDRLLEGFKLFTHAQ